MSFPLVLFLVIWAIALGLTLWGTGYALKRFKNRVKGPETLPSVSILKPVKGAEPGFEENISSFFVLDYPCYQMLFSVADRTDPAVPLIEKVMAKFPEVDCRMVVGDRPIGPNPKINNLIGSYEQAAYDLILISDSNVRVRPDYLKRVVAHLRPDVGVVTAVVAGVAPEGLGGILEATFLNSFYARWMQISRSIGHSFVVGKSMLFRRSVLERIGGLPNLGRYIAEDYMAGQAVRRLGLKVEIMRDPICQYIGKHSFRSFWSRHIRWGRIRKAQAPVAFFVEPFLGAFASGVLGALALGKFIALPFAVLFAIHLAVWLVCDILLVSILINRLDIKAVGAWILREVLALPLWIHIATGDSVNWRGKRLRILPGGLVEAL